MSMKRKICDMTADFSDDSDDMCAVTGSGGRGERKRKRGEIEKRRRDRINDCLNEIKELVPNALEKSNVNKLEKAEILQMAVDHLRMVAHNNPDRSAGRGLAELQSAGFRECMGEVSRYLVAVEGMHVEEPLRLRLMSHLHAFSSARVAPPAPLAWSTGYTQAGYQAEAGYLLPGPAHVQEKEEAAQASPPPYSAAPYSRSSYYFSGLQQGRPYRPWGADMTGGLY
jgi:YRPW motif-containing protein